MYSVEHIRSEISRLLNQNEPDKLSSIDDLMREWKSKEAELLYSLSLKYQQQYTKMAPKKLKDLYKIGPKIGSGAFAVVRKCLRKSDGKMLAMKIIKKSGYVNEEQLKLLENEINTMRKLNHPNIISMHDVFESENKIILIIDYCEGGGLFDAIIDNGAFSEQNAKIIFYKLCKALQYCHSKHIVHRDIKIEDILFREDSNMSTITLTDFGLCGNCEHGKLNKPVGTPNYVAPEILKKESYDTQVDMWTAGVILYIILSGFMPFSDESNDEFKMYEKIKKGEYESMNAPEWKNVSETAKDCVRKLLQTDPNKRMTASMALKHPWVIGLHKADSANLVMGYIRHETEHDFFPLMCPNIIYNYYEHAVVKSNISM